MRRTSEERTKNDDKLERPFRKPCKKGKKLCVERLKAWNEFPKERGRRGVYRRTND